MEYKVLILWAIYVAVFLFSAIMFWVKKDISPMHTFLNKKNLVIFFILLGLTILEIALGGNLFKDLPTFGDTDFKFH